MGLRNTSGSWQEPPPWTATVGRAAGAILIVDTGVETRAGLKEGEPPPCRIFSQDVFRVRDRSTVCTSLWAFFGKSGGKSGAGLAVFTLRIRIISVAESSHREALAWTHASTGARETRMDIPAFLTAAEAYPPPANADGTQMRFSYGTAGFRTVGTTLRSTVFRCGALAAIALARHRPRVRHRDHRQPQP